MTQDDLFGGEKEILREKFFQEAAEPAGTICPICDRFGKIYSRKHNRAMAESLVWLFQFYLRAPGQFASIGQDSPRFVLKNGGSLASNRWWGLVEQEENEDPKKHTSGHWRITDRGLAFVKGEIFIPSHVLTYNADAIDFSKSQTDISTSLGRPFDYRELMRQAGRL